MTKDIPTFIVTTSAGCDSDQSVDYGDDDLSVMTNNEALNDDLDPLQDGEASVGNSPCCRWEAQSHGPGCSMKSAPTGSPRSATPTPPRRPRIAPRRNQTFHSEKLSCSGSGLSSLPRSKNSKLSYRVMSLSRRDLMSNSLCSSNHSVKTLKTEASCCSSRRMGTSSSIATPPQQPRRNESIGSLRSVERV